MVVVAGVGVLVEEEEKATEMDQAGPATGWLLLILWLVQQIRRAPALSCALRTVVDAFRELIAVNVV